MLFCMFLIVSTPFEVYAQQEYPRTPQTITSQYNPEEQRVGEAINVIVSEYQPTVVPSSIIEKNDVPIYVFLKGVTPGSVLFGQGSPTIEPLYGIPAIKSVVVYPDDISRQYITGTPIYIQPIKTYPTLDNMGYLIVTLRKIEKEADVPDKISLNMSMRVYFDAERGFGDISMQDLALTEFNDEAVWKQSSEKQEFWKGKGYIRAYDTTSTSARIAVYDSYLNQIGSFKLNKGEISPYIRLAGSSSFFNDNLRVKLDDISGIGTKAEVRISIGNKLYNNELKTGMHLYPGSGWIVDEIVEGTLTKSGKYTESIVLKDAVGNRKTISKTYDFKGKQPFQIELTKADLSSIENSGTIWNDIINLIPLTIRKSVTDSISSISLDKRTYLNIIAYIKNNPILAPVWNKIGLSFGILDMSDDQVNELESQICKPVNMMKDDEIKDVTPSDNYASFRSYCTSINEFKSLISNHKDSGYEGDAYFNIAQIYDSMTDIPKTTNAAMQRSDSDISKTIFDLRILARHYYKKVLPYTNSDNVLEAKQSLDLIEEKLMGNVNSPDILLENENAFVRLIDVKPVTLEEQPSALIEIDGEPAKYYKDTILFSDDTGREFTWKITDLTKNSIRVRMLDKDNKAIDSVNLELGKPAELYSKLEEGKPVKSEVKSVKVISIDTKSEALVTVIPGSGIVYSESSFTVHVPIEKRAIKFSMREIDRKINKTQQQIEKLDKNIKTLNNVVTSWTATCLVTFAALAVKNSFGALARKQARNDIMPDYKEKCTREIASTGSSFDDCIFKYSDEIENNLDKAQSVIEDVNKYMESKGYESDLDYQKIGKNFRDNTGISVITPEEIRDREKWRRYVTAGIDTENSKRKYEDLNKEIKKRLDAYELAVKAVPEINNKDFLDESTEQRMSLTTTYTDVYSAVLDYKPIPEDKIKEEVKKELGIDVSVLPKAYQETEDMYNSYSVSQEGQKLSIVEKSNLRQASIKDLTNSEKYNKIDSSIKKLEDLLQKANEELDRQPLKELELQQQITNLKLQIDSLKDKLEEKAKTKDGKTILTDGSNYYVASDTLYLGDLGIRKDYVNKVAEFDDKGRPYCVPTGAGNYIKVLEWSATRDPLEFEEWNIGRDGVMCSSDDLLITHKSQYNIPQFRDRYNRAINSINSISNCKQGEIVNTPAGPFRCSQIRYRTTEAIKQPDCTDVMDPSDCRLLYGVCDPVMCPASRMNLGGKWQVSSVVETGIIGSIALGLPNFNLPYEPVPICLTGVLAGLRNIRSLLQSYADCLQTAKVEGKSVGICDNIRSIGVCDMLWREAIAIFDLHGGLISLISENLFGQLQGGGEYLTFQDSLQNLADSVNFFTKDYAQSAFAAFVGRSTSEIGTEICRSAIYGKLPEFGDFFNQLTQPENPPQFTAYFDESPWTTAGLTIQQSNIITSGYAVKEQSRYQVYYHIYAGTRPVFKTGVQRNEISYSVYLRDDLGNYIFVTDPDRQVRYATVPDGGSVDKFADVVGPARLTNICVEINGDVDCGFGKVSSAFSLNYLNDKVIQDELSRNIKTEKECAPDYPRSTPSLGSLVLPEQYGLITTGIIRVCAITNPGGGNNPGDWVKVGSCGKDEEGRNLGACWLDKRTIDIKNKALKETVAKELKLDEAKLNKQTRQFEELQQKLWGVEDSKRVLNELNFKFDEIEKKISNNPLELSNNVNAISALLVGESKNDKIESYREIQQYSIDTNSTAVAQFRIAYVYKKLGDWAKINEPSEEQVKEEIKAKVEKVSFPTGPFRCSECGKGVFNKCDEEECHSLGTNCYFDIKPIPDECKELTGFENIQSYIKSVAEEYGVDDLVALALIDKESNFNHYNPDGSILESNVKDPNKRGRGIAQVNVETARIYCTEEELFKNITKEELSNIDINLRCGLKILKRYYDLYGDNGIPKELITKYCQNSNIVKKYSNYKGWAAAVRAYNGLGCGEDADVNFVEDIQKTLIRVAKEEKYSIKEVTV
ncbi:MAG: transglycosylase SLT domain-containing protein [Nanoarchaeota archaeon]